MKKVLFVFNHPAPYKVRLFNELSKHFEVHVIFERKRASDRSKNFYFEENYKFILHKIKGLPIGRENIISNGIVKHLKQNKYDLIVMNGYSTFAEMKAINYLHKHKIPYAFYINGGIIRAGESSLKRRIKTKYISGADYYFSPDKASNKYLFYYGASESKILNYPYSTVYESEIGNGEKENSLNLPFEKVFVSSGQLIKRKNYFSLVSEWKKMPKSYGLYILGDGTEKNKILNFIRENDMKNVKLIGFLPRKHMFEYFRNSDVFLFPSKEDIYGHVINEAMSQGLPVISTKHVNSAIKLVKSDFNGCLLNELEGKDFLDSIKKYSSIEFRTNAIKTAKENTIEIMAKFHKDFIEGIIK